MVQPQWTESYPRVYFGTQPSFSRVFALDKRKLCSQNLYMEVYSSSVYNHKRLENPKYPLIVEWLNKLVYPYHGTLLSTKKH